MKIPLRYKAIILIVIISVLLSGAAILVSNNLSNRMVENSYKSRATNLARTAAMTINPKQALKLKDDVMEVYDSSAKRVSNAHSDNKDYHSYLSQYYDIKDTDEFKDISAALSKLKKINEIDGAYFVWYDSKTQNVIYLASATVIDTLAPGSYDSVSDPLYEQDIAITKDTREGFPAMITNVDKFGWMATAGAPVYSGRTLAGFAMIDISMNKIHKEQTEFLESMIIIQLVLTIAICAIGLLCINRGLIKPINQLSEATEKFSHEKNADQHSSFSELDINTGDEIEALADSMKQMELEINDKISSIMQISSELKQTKLHAEQMNTLAKKDALTGIRNKLAYDEEIAFLEKTLSREFFRFGIAVIDLDGLKIINDTYGHENGNISIKNLSELICTVFAHSPVFRIGGDEFAAILKGHDYEKVDDLIVTFNELILQMQASPYLRPWEKISASIGYALYNPKIDNSASDVFNRADQTMYKWKKRGKAERDKAKKSE